MPSRGTVFAVVHLLAVSEPDVRKQALQWGAYAAPPPSPPVQPASGDVTAQLECLGNLNAARVSTDEEFAAATAELLGL